MNLENIYNLQTKQKMKWKILVLTFKLTENSWYEFVNHKDLKIGILSRNTLSYEDINKKKSFVCFASFQDFLGKNSRLLKLKINGQNKINWDRRNFTISLWIRGQRGLRHILKR